MNNTEISHRINILVEKLNNKLVDYYKTHFKILEPKKILREDGKKYSKLIERSEAGAGTYSHSVYGFIDLNTGDILKAASWKAPAKGKRASINDDDYGMMACGPYGIHYIKGPNYSWD